MSLETKEPRAEPLPNRRRMPCATIKQSSGGANLGGVREGDRTGKADRVSRENSSGASVTQLAGQGGQPTKLAGAAGVVGVPRSSVDLPDSITSSERRWGTWVRVEGNSNETGDGQGDLDKNSAKVSGAARFTVTVGASSTVEAPSESRMR
jgi:hypothetical protein